MEKEKYCIKPGYLMREIAGEYLAVPTDAQNGSGHIVILNIVSKLLWEELQTEKTLDELVKAVTAEFEVSPEEAAEDIADFIKQLEENNLIK
ncbi:MAG: PqqD family protein [Clostridiaceae bacterium]|nr:PqqD family protein [Clostridiaceae bacterium]MDO4495523.1 PqqD family protein [Clostridiaceae bacterium]